ncbi:Non-histone chromosomal protein [Lachnellula subtilissima]|uniref:Non-histone chromosomal protein n=1 Tax=Lachnellula subtilissima TaxID=602034 RepID=A0A8H8UFB4_9HELO|nr:Non-histone chromosomal protein [Lachnellula subtilissima]
MLSSIGRAALQRGGAGARYVSTHRAAFSIWSLQRVNASRGANGSNTKSELAISIPRFYATATKTATKPKTTVTKTTKTTKTAKTKPRTTAKKSVKKPVKKVAKPKAKKPKKPTKKVLTEDQQHRVDVKSLKERALSPPTGGANTAWSIVFQQEVKQNGGGPGPSGVANSAKTAAAKYKALSPQEKESLNQKANENKALTDIAFKKWVETHTPEQIRDANNARSMLKRKLGKHHAYPPITDPRLPKRAASAYLFFVKDRFTSGDFKGISIVEATRLIAAEWKALAAGERKPFEARSEADKQRYYQEFKTVYHQESAGVAKSTT